MKRMGKLGLAIAAIVAAVEVAAQGPAGPVPKDSPAIAIEAAGVKAHMAFLADDLLEGREAGTRGDALAQLYIRTQFAAAGLEPAGEAGSYLQRVRVRATTLIADSVDFRIAG